MSGSFHNRRYRLFQCTNLLVFVFTFCNVIVLFGIDVLILSSVVVSSGGGSKWMPNFLANPWYLQSVWHLCLLHMKVSFSIIPTICCAMQSASHCVCSVLISCSVPFLGVRSQTYLHVFQ